MTGCENGAADNDFPWEEVMAIGFGVLMLSSDEFWSMSLKEIEAAVHGLYGRPYGGSSPSRTAFDKLMDAFPD